MNPLDRRAPVVAAWLLVVGALAYAGVSSYNRVVGQGTDFNVPYMAGQIAASDHPQTLYVEHAPRGASYTYIYPPLLAILMIPLSRLPLGVAGVIWFFLSVAFTVHSAWLLASGLPGIERRRRGAFMGLTLLLTIGFTVENIFLGQVHALLLWLMTCSWHFLRKRWSMTGAAFMATATVVKLIPGVFVLYFLVRREWKALAAFVLVAALLGAGLPFLVFERATASTMLRGFYAIQIQPYFAAESGTAGAPGIYHRTAVRKTLHDQDLGAVLQRHFTADHGLRDGARDYSWLNIVQWPTPAVRKAVFVLFLLFVGITLVVLLRGAAHAPNTSTLDAHFAIFTVMSLLLAPRNRLTYMTVFLIPYSVVLAQVGEVPGDDRARHLAWVVVGGTFVLSSLMGFPLFRALSVGFYATLWLWMGLLVWCAENRGVSSR